MIEGALPGVRVVEWGNFISAPFCGKVLTELGADVIKLEAPISGDDSRRHGPYPGGVADQERSGLFLLANINKRGVSLDLRSQKGREVLNRLLEGADVFLLNQRPDVVQELALDYESLRPRFPQLIATAITPYGLTGPYKGYRGCDLTVNALSGLSFGTGYPHREPLTTPLYQGVGRQQRCGAGQLLPGCIAKVGTGLSGVAAGSSGYNLCVHAGDGGNRTPSRRSGLRPHHPGIIRFHELGGLPRG